MSHCTDMNIHKLCAHNLPLSTRTVKAANEVEAFALLAEDLKYVANQFRRLHSKKLQHAFRYYSHQWRNWGATFVQAAWRRYAKNKKEMELARLENLYHMQGIYEEGDYDDEDSGGESSSVDNANRLQHLGATMLPSKFAANTRRGGAANQKPPIPDSGGSSLKMPMLFETQDPDFASDS